MASAAIGADPIAARLHALPVRAMFAAITAALLASIVLVLAFGPARPVA